MITLFAIKPLSGSPADGIDNVNISVFSRLDKNKIVFLTEAPDDFEERGSIRKMKLKNKSGWRRTAEKILLMRKIKPDYLFGNGGVSDIAFLLFKPFRVKYLIDWHTVLLKDEGFWRVKTPWFVRRFIFGRADLIIAVSEFAAESVRKYFPDKKIVGILNGVDLELFNPGKGNEKYLRQRYAIDFSRPLVVFVGALVPRKRPDLFIELAKSCQEANFVVIGRLISEHHPAFGGAMSQKLKNFQWVEKMPREDIAVLLASSKVFVFPSLNDASAAVILEAMASGCVPIVSKSGGNAEFLKDGVSGFVIEPNKNERGEFLKKIDLLIYDRAFWQKVSISARRESENHSWDKAAKEYEDNLLRS